MYVFRGAPYEVGFGIGRVIGHSIKHDLVNRLRGLPEGMTLADVHAWLTVAWSLTEQRYPRVAAELRGVAAGAGVALLDYLLVMSDELWDAAAKYGGCTDVAVRSPKLLIGHNNDEARDRQMWLIRSEGANGRWLTSLYLNGVSAGSNSDGIVLTGNAVYASDVKLGIPKMVLSRAILDATTLREAVGIATDCYRASSYNNVLADSDGRFLALEGSATRVVPQRLDADGFYAHTNHYLHPSLRAVENGGAVPPGRLRSTRHRLHRAKQLLQHGVPHSVASVIALLSDHAGAQGSGICRHGRDNIATLATLVYSPTEKTVWASLGNPCEGGFKRVNYGVAP